MDNTGRETNKPRTPLYQVVIDDILKSIDEGAFSFDVPICTESKLMEQYNISRITARRAMTELESRGVLYRKRGVGSFVSRDIYSRSESKPQPANRHFAFLFPFDTSRTGLTTACQSANTVLMVEDCYASTFITEEGETGRTGRSMLKQLLSMDVAGVAYYPKTSNYHLNILNEFVYQGKPVVIIDVPSQCPYVSSVSSDNFGGIQLLMEHLYEQGHRNIAYVSGIGADDRPTVCDRLGGYLQFHDRMGLKIRGEHVITTMTEQRRAEPSPIEGRTALHETVQQLFKRGVTAILGEHDQMAFEMILACRDLNIRVPEDMSICGFDDSEWAHLFPGNITTVRQDMEQIGRHVANLLLKGQSAPLKNIQHIVVPTELVQGMTTGPVAG